MKEEVRRWVEKAIDDLDKAGILFRNQKYDGVVFFCQQAAEKALKGLSLKEKNRIKKIHDLVILGKDVDLPQNLLDYCKELTGAYVYSRYPEVEEEKDIDKISAKFINYAREVLEWVKKRI